MLPRHLTGETVFEIETCGMNTLSPGLVACCDGPGSGWRHMDNLEARPTSILLYSLDLNIGEGTEKDVALGFLARRDVVLSMQVLQEFYVQAARARRARPFSHENAVGLIRAWSRFEVVGNTQVLLKAGLALASICAAVAPGCSHRCGCRWRRLRRVNHGRSQFRPGRRWRAEHQPFHVRRCISALGLRLVRGAWLWKTRNRRVRDRRQQVPDGCLRRDRAAYPVLDSM